MSDEEDDYMSDKFLAGLQDVTPSLIKNRAKKRQLDIEIKHKENIKKQKDLMKQKTSLVDNETLQAALSKPLSEENKGFKLLAKMGYKPGQALGRPVDEEKQTSSKSEGRLVEPIGITIKSDRQGLGREAALKELKERRHKIRQQRLNKGCSDKTSVEDFRRRTNQKLEERFILNALRRCQVTCENLDIENDVANPELLWFWPNRTKQASDEDKELSENKDEEEELDEEGEEFSSQEKLEMLTSYVRTSYLFCFWCGVQYNDESDLEKNCPGLTKDDH